MLIYRYYSKELFANKNSNCPLLVVSCCGLWEVGCGIEQRAKGAFHLRSAALEAEGKGKERCEMWDVGYEMWEMSKNVKPPRKPELENQGNWESHWYPGATRIAWSLFENIWYPSSSPIS